MIWLARQQRQLLLLLPIYILSYLSYPNLAESFSHPTHGPPARSEALQTSSFLSARGAGVFNTGTASSFHSITQKKNTTLLNSESPADSGVSGVLGPHGKSPVGAEETPGDLPGATSAAADAAELEAAFAAVVAAAAKTLNVSSASRCQDNEKDSSSDTDATLSVSSVDASTTALKGACDSFLSKVSNAFGLKNAREATGVVYLHRSSGGGGKLFVDRQKLLRLRGQQKKGSWSLHFLGTGAMQASASRATSSILFSRGDGSAWLFDCGGGLSPTHAASVSRKNAPEAAATSATAAAATAGLTTRLQQAVALAVAAESIKGEQPDEPHQQQQPKRRRVGVVQRVFVTHLHGDHCLGIPAFLAQIAQDPEQGNRHVEIIGPEGLRNLLRCILHGTSARRLPAFSVVELRGVPHLHHRRSRSIRLPPLPPAPSEVAGRPDLELNADGSYDVFEDAGIHVKAAPIRHLVPCVGYVVSEKRSRQPLRADVLDPIIARNAQELADKDKWPQLRGEPKAVYKLLTEMVHTRKPFVFPDGSIVGPSDVFGEALEPRKFCIAFDTCDASRLIPFARGCDVLVHEATMSGVKGTSSKVDDSVDPLPPAIKSKCLPGEVSAATAEGRVTAKDLMEPHVQAASAAAFERGHASAAMAGAFAASVGASRLILTHFSQRYRGDAALRSVLTMQRVEEEAR
ncbi:hypothetical protein Emed_001390 [Eimeria media]